MRDSLNYTILPPPPSVVQDNCISYNSTITTLPSNGYYGYQPPINSDNKDVDNHDGRQQQQQQMDVVMQFEEYDNRRRFETVNNRKRCWEISGDIRQFKKRRQNHDIHDTSLTTIIHQPTTTTTTTTTTGSSTKEVVWLRKPTHNLPDMPRCIMGHYI